MCNPKKCEYNLDENFNCMSMQKPLANEGWIGETWWQERTFVLHQDLNEFVEGHYSVWPMTSKEYNLIDIGL